VQAVAVVLMQAHSRGFLARIDAAPRAHAIELTQLG